MTVPENVSARRFNWPADYYSGPAPKAVLPQWMPFGCGAIAVVMLILVFAGGAFLSSGGFLEVMDFAIGMSASEMKGFYASDVSAAQRKSLDDEVVRMRRNMREKKISIASMQPFLESLRNASGDRKVTVQEAAAMENIARRINAKAKQRENRPSP